ncbi:MAG: RHS repeat-associated core domain-containing protein [Chlamydiota bacterium]
MLLRYLLLLLPILAHSVQDFLLAEEDYTLCHHVNVITGHLNLLMEDNVVKGPTPLPIIRSYTSAGALERARDNSDKTRHTMKGKWNFAGGWNLFSHLYLLVKESKGIEHEAYLTESSGASFHFIDCTWKNPGFFGPIGWNRNLDHRQVCQSRHHFWLDTKQARATLILPNGGKRIYEQGSSQYFYLLKQETLPNGHQILYSYSNGSLKKIALANPDGSKIFSWITMDVLEKKPPHHLHLETSDGNHFRYYTREYNDRYYFKHLDSNRIPSEHFLYSGARSGIGVRVETFQVEGKHQFTAHYCLPGDKKEEEKWKKKPHKKPLHADRVSSIDGPTGKVASFSYQEGVTDVRDAGNILTRYRYCKEHVDRIEYFDEHDQLYAYQQFIWQGHLLESRVLCDANGKAIFGKQFNYDSYENIKEEILIGNLTGTAKERFDWGKYSGEESYYKYYEYLPGFNVKTVEEEENGPTYRYHYFPGTNLLTAKFTYDGSNIIRREFFFYDGDHLLFEEITDNGISTDHHDLTSVTERRIRWYKHNPNGLPDSVAHYYQDGQQNVLLNRIEYVYTKNRITQERFFDSNGHHRYTLETKYDSHGNVIAKKDPLGQWSTYRYNLRDELEEETEPGKQTRILTYDPAGRLIKTEVGSKTASVNYDLKGRAFVKKDFKGHETKYDYDPFSRCIATRLPKVHDENGELYEPVLQYGYDIQGHLTSETDLRGAHTETFYTTFGKPYRIIHPNGTETHHIYNKNSTLAKTILPDLTEISYSYDILQRMIKKIIASSSSDILSEETWSYDAYHLKSYTDPRGLTTDYIYDGAGRKIREETEDRIRIFEYDALGFLERTSDGCTTHVQIHDVIGNVIHEWIEDTASRRENEMYFIYEDSRKASARRITSQKEALDFFSYDEEGRLKTHTDPDGNITQFIYTDSTKTTIDPLGHISIETYDPVNRLVLVKKKDAAEKTYSKEEIFYDRSNNKAKIITTLYRGIHPLKTLTTCLNYNLMRQMIRQIDAGGKKTTFDYFPLENKTEKTLPGGIRITTTCDGLGRTLELFSSDGTIHYEYFYSPQEIRILDHVFKRTLTRSYNLFGELIHENGGCSRSYDAQGRCKELILPDGSFIRYTYHGMHMSSVARYNSSGTPLYQHTYSFFDENGHVVLEEMIGNLGTIETEHDHFERPSRQTSPYLSQSVSFGPTHLVKKMTTTLFGEKTYTYDPLNQLQIENDIHYNFDSLGNSTNYEFSDSLELQKTATDELKYDLDGNPLQKITLFDTYIYSYDALGRLTEIKSGEKTVRYTYDPLSRLYSKEILGLEPQFYLYDKEREIGTFQGGILQELKVLGLGIKGEIGGAIALELSSDVFAPLHDFSGNIIALVSLDGYIAESYNLTAFGNEESTTSHRNPWRFSSKRTEETGLIYFGYRFYDPTFGRWLTPDPAGYTDGLNLYLYVLNNPLNRLDLFGLRSESLFGEHEISAYVPITDISILAQKVQPYPGICGGISTTFVFACGHLHRLKFTPEEMDMGCFNFFDYFGELMPQGQGYIGLLHPIHGIENTLGDFIGMSQKRYDAIPEKPLLIGMYFASLSLGDSLERVKIEREGKMTDRITIEKHFIETATEFIDTYHEGNYMLTSPHSEGGLVATRSISLASGKNKDYIKNTYLSIGVGAAEPLSNEFAHKAIDFYSESDHVTKRFAKPFLNDPNYDIRIVACISKWSERSFYLADHAVLGSTYREAYMEGLKELKKEGYKFYDAQNR